MQLLGRIAAVSCSASHSFSKRPVPSVLLLPGLGVQGDAHSGATVQHLSRVRRDPTQPNLRQVHLLHTELLQQLRSDGFAVDCGSLGENITTEGLDLLGLPQGTRLHLGDSAVLQVTGLRNPCAQLDHYANGLMAAVLARDAQGALVRKAGIMSVVLAGGSVAAGDVMRVELPALPHRALEPV